MSAAEDMESLGDAAVRLWLRDDGRTRQSTRKHRGERSWTDERGRHAAELGDRHGRYAARGGVSCRGNGDVYVDIVERSGWACGDCHGDGGACFGFEGECAHVDVATEAARG